MNLRLRALLRDHGRHPWNILLSVLGIALGVAVVVAVDIANDSARRAFALSLDAVSGRATHQILGGPAGLDEELHASLRRAGFRDSAPVLEGHVRVQGETLILLGLDPFAEAPFRDYSAGVGDGGAGRIITAGDAVLLDENTAARLGLSPGMDLELELRGVVHELRLLDVIAADIPGLDGIMIADIAHAQVLLDRLGRLDRIDLVLADEADVSRLQSLLPPGAELVTTQSRNQATLQLSRAFHVNLSAMSLLALLVGGFLIYNTMIFAVLRRRRLLALLRFQGLTAAGLFRQVLGEALILGLVGSLLGMVLGIWIGGFLLQLMTRTISDMYFVINVSQVNLSALVLAKGLLLGLGASLTAALGPAWEAARISPRDALQRSSLERRVGRLLPWLLPAGLLLMAAGAALLAWPGQGLVSGFAALFLLILGYALLVPPLMAGLSRLFSERLGRLLGATGRLAARGLGAGMSRSGLAAAALCMAVAATIGVGIMVASFRSTVDVWLGQTLQSDFYVSAPGRSGLGLNPGLPPQAREQVLALPTVDQVSTARRVHVQSPQGTVELMAVDPAARTPQGYRYLKLMPADTGSGRSLPRADALWQRMASEPGVLISEPLAWRLDISVGETLSLRTDRGLQGFTVLGVVQEYGSDRGLVTMHRALYERYWDDPGIASLGIYLAQGASLQTGLEQLRALAAGWDAPARVTSSSEIHDLSMEIFDRSFAITQILRLLTVGVAAIAILSALMALQLERAREHAVLRAIGMTPGALWWMVSLQAAMLGLVAGLAALPLGLLMSVVLIEVINQRSFGWSMQFLLPGRVLAEGLLLALAASVLAGLYPGYRMARARPIEHLRED